MGPDYMLNLGEPKKKKEQPRQDVKSQESEVKVDENQITLEDVMAAQTEPKQVPPKEKANDQKQTKSEPPKEQSFLEYMLPNSGQFIAMILLILFTVGITSYAMMPPPPNQWELNTQVYNMRSNVPHLPSGERFQYGVQYRSDSTAYMVRMIGNRVSNIDLDGLKEWMVNNQADFGYTSHKAGVDVVYATCQVYDVDGDHYATLLVPPNTTEASEVITIWESAYPSGLEIYIVGDREFVE